MMQIVKIWWHLQSWFVLSKGTTVCSYCVVIDAFVQHRDVIESNSIGNSASISLIEKFKLLINFNEWIAQVSTKPPN